MKKTTTGGEVGSVIADADKLTEITAKWPHLVDGFVSGSGKPKLARHLLTAPFDDRHPMERTIREFAVEYFGVESFDDLLTDKAKAHRKQNQRAKGRRGGHGSAATEATMPANPANRLSNLVALYPHLIDSFKASAMAATWPPKTNEAQKRMYVNTLLYGSFDRLIPRFPLVLQNLAVEVFGLDRFEDCYTKARIEFKNARPQRLSWSVSDRQQLRKIGDGIASLSSRGVSVRADKDTVIFEADGVEPITISANGKVEYRPRLDC